eukprot:422549_1
MSYCVFYEVCIIFDFFFFNFLSTNNKVFISFSLIASMTSRFSGQSSKIPPHNISPFSRFSPQSPSSDQFDKPHLPPYLSPYCPYNSTTNPTNIPVHSDSTTPEQCTDSKSPPNTVPKNPSELCNSVNNSHKTVTVPLPDSPLLPLPDTPLLPDENPSHDSHDSVDRLSIALTMDTRQRPKRRSKYFHEPFGAYDNDELDAAFMDQPFGAYNNDEFKYDRLCIHCTIAAELASNGNTTWILSTCTFCGEKRPDVGQVVSEDLGHKIEEAQSGDLGRCGKMTITKDDTIILNGMGHKDDINGSSEVEVNDRTYEKEKL